MALAKQDGCWSLTSLKEKLIKIGAKVIDQGRYFTFQMAEVRSCQYPSVAAISTQSGGLRVDAG